MGLFILSPNYLIICNNFQVATAIAILSLALLVSGEPPVPQNQYGPPSTSYGVPSNSYQAPSSQYGPPQQQQRPQQNYLPPTNSYVPPKNQYIPPSNQYIPPSNNYQAPSSNYGAPAQTTAIFTKPSSNYGAPSQGYSSGGNQGYESNAPAKYDFEYKVDDYQSGNDFGHMESRDGSKTVGKYYVLLPDGRKQVS